MNTLYSLCNWRQQNRVLRHINSNLIVRLKETSSMFEWLGIYATCPLMSLRNVHGLCSPIAGSGNARTRARHRGELRRGLSRRIAVSASQGQCVHSLQQSPWISVVRARILHKDIHISDSTWTANSPGATTSSINGLALTKMYWLLGRDFPSPIQNHPQTHLDLRHPTLGHGLHIKHWDPWAFPIQDFAPTCRRTAVRAQPSHPSGPSNAFSQGRNLPLKSQLLHPPHHPSPWPSSSPPGTTRHQAIATTYAKRSAWQIRLVIVVVIILVSKVQSVSPPL
jgi:hypothetical protein